MHASWQLWNSAPTSASVAEARTFAHDTAGDVDGSIERRRNGGRSGGGRHGAEKEEAACARTGIRLG